MSDDLVTSVDGASKLMDLYGCWPSFHDAAVDDVLIEREGPTVTISLRLNALRFEEEKEADVLRAKVKIRWHEVRDLTLSGIDWDENNWIGGLTITPRQTGSYSEIHRMDGIYGSIVAGRIEVVDAQPIHQSDP
jgi:hypothetical protein